MSHRIYFGFSSVRNNKYMFENAFANYAIRIYLKAMPGTEINKITL